MVLNSAPYNPGPGTQATEHLSGKKHERAMRHVGHCLLTKGGIAEFFTRINRELPDFEQIGPEDALRDYIADCGGDPERTMAHLKW